MKENYETGRDKFEWDGVNNRLEEENWEGKIALKTF